MQRSLVALVLVAIVLVLYAPIALGGKTWDDVRYHTEIAPPRIAAADSVLHGELPTWSDGTALGVPLLGEPTHGAAYIPGWIAATPHALDLFLIVHVLWCALGVALWARRRGASELGALVAGALIATSSVIASAALRGALPALAHLPWLAIAAAGISSAPSRRAQTRYVIATAALLALVGLAGQLVVLAHAIAIVVLSLARSGTRSRVASIVLLAIAIGCGLAIAALQWMPALLVRGDTAGASTNALSIARAVELVIPRTIADAWLPTIYVGAPLLVLAGFGKPQLRFIVLGTALLVLAFAHAEVHIATLAILAAAHAGTGFDRVSEWLGRRLLLVVVAIAPTAAALPLLFHVTDRAIVGEPPAWANAAITAAEVAVREGKAEPRQPLRVFRPVMNLDKHAGEETLADAIATFAGSSAAKWGIGTPRSDDPARPAAHDRVWLAAASAGGSLLDRYGVGFAILPSSMVSADREPVAIATRGRWALVRLPASPPAALVYEWIFAPDNDAALARLFPPGATSGLSSGMIVLQGQAAQNQDEPGPAESCAIERWSGASIELRCTTDRAAYHVISSTAARGWSVKIDGRDTPWLVADIMRRAVALPPGEHRITWRYWPPGLTIGLVLAALGSVGLLALWLLYGRDPDTQDRPPDPPRTDAN